MILAWHNQIESATLSSDATFETTLPLSNLQTYLLPEVARTTAADSFTITATWASAKSIGCIFIANHNLQRLSYLTITCYKNAEIVHTSGQLAVVPTKSGSLVGAVIEPTLRHDLSYWLSANISVDTVEIEITNIGSNTYVQIGRLFIAESYQTDQDVDFGDSPIKYNDLSEIKTTPRGIRYAYQQQKLRSVDLTLKYMSENEAFDDVFEAQRMIGLVGEVVYAQKGLPTLTSESSGLAQSYAFFNSCFIANFVELNPLNQVFYSGYTTVLKLLEVAV